jgi:hypothetical protein
MVNYSVVKAWVAKLVGQTLNIVAQDITTTGTITGGDLAATDDLTVGDDATITGDLTLSAQTAGRVLYTGTAGLVSSEAALAYNAGTDTLTVTNATVSTALTCTAAATVGTTLGVTGDITAAGGFRRSVGPFTAPGAAGVTAASQTNLDCRYVHTVTAAAASLSWVAPRAGSIMALSAALDQAITGAGTTITVSAVKNGTEVALTVVLTQAGAETKGQSTATKDTLTFVAGDIIGVSYTSTGISNTPVLVATLEVEC